jgi:uncharacterized protein
MSLMIPKVTLVFAAALVVLHLWLSMRVGRVRGSEGVSVGDGGNERVIRRMRAHANFAENAPLTLGLVLAIELSFGASLWLWGAAAAFVGARVLHGLGMDGWYPGRSIGTVLSFGLELALAVWAVAIVATAHAPALPAPVAVDGSAQG